MCWVVGEDDVEPREFVEWVLMALLKSDKIWNLVMKNKVGWKFDVMKLGHQLSKDVYNNVLTLEWY